MLAVTNTSPWLIGSGSRKIDSSRSASASDAPGERGRRIEHDVLVARQAGDGGVFWGSLAEAHGDHLQHFVAGCVTEAVVDVLEAVEVDEVQRRVAVGLPGHPQAVVDPFEQQQYGSADGSARRSGR